MVRYLVETNFANLAMMGFMLFFLTAEGTFTKRVRLLFFFATMGTILLILFDALDRYMISDPSYAATRNVINIACYALRPLTMYLMSCIVCRKTSKIQQLTILPLLMMTVLDILSPRYGLVFSITPENKLVHGPLWMLFITVNIFYMGLVTVRTFRRFRGNGRSEIVTMVLIVLMAVVSVVGEGVFVLYGLVPAASSVGLVFYFLLYQVQFHKRDPMTDTLNRRCFQHDAERRLLKSMIIVSIDLNDLKTINDKYGHGAGDKAICTLASVVRDALLPSCRLYRTGGDEFMILCMRRNRQQVDHMIDNIHAAMAETKYSAALGAASYIPGMSFEDACAMADTNMYHNKAVMKGTMCTMKRVEPKN